MKILTKRAVALLILSLLLILGLIIFTVQYVVEASKWAQHANNKHLFSNGQLKTTGKLYDRKGEMLLRTVEGVRKYNDSRDVRQALMHTIGDGSGNVATSTEVAFGGKLSGWSLLNGAYRFNSKSEELNSDLTLTLDSGLCAVAYDALNGRKGTVGVYNYKTGEIICMVSSPSFDPKNPPDVAASPEKYEGVYINRFLSAAYTPGSVFKLVTAAAAIDNLPDINTKVYHCKGQEIINGNKVTCLKAHGTVNLEEALAKSCNIAFAHISLELGGQKLQEYADKAGFNSSLEVDHIKTAAGKVTVADATGGDLAWAGIGQYSDTANPLNFMAYVGSIANNGIRVAPRLIKSQTGFDAVLPNSGAQKKRILSEETARTLGAMMRNNVVSEYGERNFKGLELCAKSGTAEVGGNQKPHSWFVGYLDREDYPLAFVVVVENGGTGSKVAGSVAAKVLKEAVARNDGEE